MLRKTLLASATIWLSLLSPLSAADLPGWKISEICREDSDRAHCRLDESIARQRLSGSWPFLQKAWRETCLANFAPPVEPSWRILGDCLQEQARLAETARLEESLAVTRRIEEEIREKREAEAEAARRAAEEEARRRAEAEAAQQRAAEEEARRKAEAEAAQRRAAEEEARRMAETEAAQQRAASEQAAAERAVEADACENRLSEIAARGVIEFETSSAAIAQTALPTLDELVAAIADCKGLKVTVEGHTDNTGVPEKNASLSEARAKSVADYIVGKGIEADRVAAKGFGASQPVAANDTPEGRAKNRRIVFQVE